MRNVSMVIEKIEDIKEVEITLRDIIAAESLKTDDFDIGTSVSIIEDAIEYLDEYIDALKQLKIQQ